MSCLCPIPIRTVQVVVSTAATYQKVAYASSSIWIVSLRAFGIYPVTMVIVVGDQWRHHYQRLAVTLIKGSCDDWILWRLGTLVLGLAWTGLVAVSADVQLTFGADGPLIILQGDLSS
ncbi:uncharacterized protein EI90DRAFT_3035868 [Cantharellus anzutake]|uniref:uncharacterized protein n=1 Tax=Cantharellus anzutake TaxID=1750568 RepID=UPI0019058CFE|nr:uncharacterized protein EI90DRAFT_3035868 [Cantharellus anzutake]KAF8340522.1 hypothetical protein EI90DRAFT_3035868 [Cantharellus anzutake]